MPGVIELGALIVSSIATTTLAANALYLGTLALGYAGLAYGAALLQSLFVQKPSVPKPEDGSYNLKQNVPSDPIILGRAKKGGDYLGLEESGGTAYHEICHAAHRIQGYVQHYLHDDPVTVGSDGVVAAIGKKYRSSTVSIKTRLGLNAETAFADLVSTFPTIYTTAHRGDGLARVLMSVKTVDSEDYLSVFPNQMPVHTAVIDGALVYDPRDGTQNVNDKDSYKFATNLALLRLHHLTNPWGGKLGKADMYMPEWSHAADVSDQTVINRAGANEPRYHGGLWFRANNDQIQVGRLLDQAGEMVVYERTDGLVGVHAGEYVPPVIRLDGDSILSLSYKANKSEAATVLAVRGRYTDPNQTYATVDAAIVGNPYLSDDDTERTKTVDNQVIQSHNHCQRIQTITEIRANAPRVSILANYEEASDVGQYRFVRVHYPPKLKEAIIEITSTPKLSLANMTVEFSGIVVPETLYDFTASTDEGLPPTVPIRLVSTGVPLPTDFNVVIMTDNLGGGNKAAYALATWTPAANSLRYEFEWQPTAGSSQVPNSLVAKSGEVSARSSYLADGTNYRFRLRAWSNGVPSDWTSYITRDVVADSTVPAQPMDMQAPKTGTTIAPSARSANDNTRYLVFKRGTTAQSFAAATLLGRYLVGPNQVIQLGADSPGNGTWKYWCGSENGSGVPSATQASVTVTVP